MRAVLSCMRACADESAEPHAHPAPSPGPMVEATPETAATPSSSAAAAALVTEEDHPHATGGSITTAFVAALKKCEKQPANLYTTAGGNSLAASGKVIRASSTGRIGPLPDGTFSSAQQLNSLRSSFPPITHQRSQLGPQADSLKRSEPTAVIGTGARFNDTRFISHQHSKVGRGALHSGKGQSIFVCRCLWALSLSSFTTADAFAALHPGTRRVRTQAGAGIPAAPEAARPSRRRWPLCCELFKVRKTSQGEGMCPFVPPRSSPAPPCPRPRAGPRDASRCKTGRTRRLLAGQARVRCCCCATPQLVTLSSLRTCKREPESSTRSLSPASLPPYAVPRRAGGRPTQQASLPSAHRLCKKQAAGCWQVGPVACTRGLQA